MKADAIDFNHMLLDGDQYVIPIFQRAYIWHHKQWIDIWEDIAELLDEDLGPGHFLGSIVCTSVDNQLGQIQSHMIVDGQQRIVTLFALLCAIRDVAKSKPSISSLAEEIQDKYLIQKNGHGYEKYKLLPRTAYRDTFFEMMEGNPRTGQQDSIKTAYNFFKERLSVDSFNEARLKDFFVAVTKRLRLVLITLAKDENPFPIFEALNGTGIDLLQSDMIRNFVFMKMNLEHQDDFDSNKWQYLENLFQETGKFKAVSLDDFYKHFLMSSGDYVRDEEIFVKFRKQMKAKDANQIVSDLRSPAAFYIQFNRPETIQDIEIRTELSRIFKLGETSCFPLLLDLFERNGKSELDRATLIRILRALQSFILRRRALGLTTRPYGKWFAEMSGLKTRRLELDLYQIFVIRGWPEDAEFVPALSTSGLCKSGVDELILEALEYSVGKREPVDGSTTRVEHVMPEAIGDDVEGQSWKDMLGSRWQNVHARWLHTLGNLTLIRHDLELSRSSFTEKKTVYASSKIGLNRYFDSVNSWSEEEIRTRASKLAELVTSIWPRRLT